jgi:hypothetical protein
MRFHRVMSVALALLPLTVVHAQGAPMPRSRFGITAGINSSTVVGDNTEDATRKSGFMIGAVNVSPIAPSFAIQTEVLYTMKGAGASDEGIDATVKLNYIEIPVLARFEIPASGNVKPFLYAGPAISFKMSCTAEAEFRGNKISTDCDDEQESFKVKSVDYSAVIGGGLGFDVRGKMLTIGARYTHGFANIGDEGNAKNRVISAVATFELPWGG